MLEDQINPYKYSQITKKYNILTFSLYLLAFLTSTLISKKVTAQIVPDNTLPTNSQVQSGCTVCEIKGGTVNGVNLYHSFQEFSIPTNGQALFNNSLGIENILTRVTGNSISNIDGLIRTNGRANLFLINPNGIIFGNNASLNIGGSFTATTSNSLKFFDGSEFSATNPQAPPLLTVNITPGLQYAESQTGAKITNFGNLSVGQDFNFVADQLDLQGTLTAVNDFILQATANLQIQDSTITTAGGNFDIDAGQLNLINTTINTNPNNSGGEIAVKVSDSANLTNSTISTNQQGSITVSANTLTLDHQAKITTNTASGTSGDIQLLNLKSLQISNSEISANAVDGLAGNIIINASDSINLDSGSRIASEASQGDAGFVEINTGQFTMINGAEISVSSSDDAGYLRLTANTVTLDKQAKIVANTASGIGGEIEVLGLKSLQLSNNSVITASTINSEAGDITINASDFINLDSGSLIASEAIDQGDAGFVEINTGQFTMSNGTEISVSSPNDAGYLRLTANTVTLDQQAKIKANTSSGTGGEIELLGLKSLQLSNNSSILSVTIDGEAGDITIHTSDFINLDHGSLISSGAINQGKAGFVDITTGQFTMSNGANINVNSKDNTAGYLRLEANTVILDQQAKIEANTFSSNGGEIELLGLESLQLSNNSYISAATNNGQAGDVTINASDFISLDNDSLISSESIGNGNAGFIDITTGELNINNSSRVSVSSQNNTGGYTRITANKVILDNQAQISGETFSGIGGDIELLELKSLQLSNNSAITASTANGEAGNITVYASDLIKLDSGSRIASEATGKGDAGFVDITTGQFTISNQAIATVSSPLGEAGYLTITANNLFLDQGLLTAETGLGETGENATINLFVQDLLLMRNNSRISAQAFNNAQGGNIYIDAQNGFVVALPFEDSDINANAEQGNGGQIEITTQGIFGTEYRLQGTAKSDITASSQFGLNGDVSINVLSIDPSQGLLSLPTSLIDVSNQIVQGCAAGSKLVSSKNKFTVAGRGGIPSSPHDLLTGTTALVELVDLVPSQNNQENSKSVGVSSSPTTKIVEAQGWVIDSKGEVHLVAQVAKALPHSPVLPTASCSVP
ncbi:filamentous hemagglutinin N-terminal domain-containing protein [Anabaena cylindrica UHCC 0172]|uniref:two-partner secretion domain-containing protein n=1 Tax=Anabaena cylindrica TaxID=1165 RepID=UPI002B1F417C|nr:filamentous hemagglutinin N-terminal domain-containing protein [Anabaena cylindrica]MEA5550751.1 filamentous hemagglutinin N-terminal domain-containing protein [Anabaena cylindrica UHCC 0172]